MIHRANTTANNNTAVGQGSLMANTTGYEHSRWSNAMAANTTGGFNAFWKRSFKTLLLLKLLLEILL